MSGVVLALALAACGGGGGGGGEALTGSGEPANGVPTWAGGDRIEFSDIPAVQELDDLHDLLLDVLEAFTEEGAEKDFLGAVTPEDRSVLSGASAVLGPVLMGQTPTLKYDYIRGEARMHFARAETIADNAVDLAEGTRSQIEIETDMRGGHRTDYDEVSYRREINEAYQHVRTAHEGLVAAYDTLVTASTSLENASAISDDALEMLDEAGERLDQVGVALEGSVLAPDGDAGDTG